MNGELRKLGVEGNPRMGARVETADAGREQAEKAPFTRIIDRTGQAIYGGIHNQGDVCAMYGIYILIV